MIVPIGRILGFPASEAEPINEERARELRRIAEKYYPIDHEGQNEEKLA